MTSVNSPFRYAGGKFYARSLIQEHIPTHEIYAEPFAGGASIFFSKMKVKDNWLNDLDADLIGVYKIIRDRPEDLITALDGEVATKQRHTYFKNEYKPQDDFTKAVRWYYLNRTSFSGIMNSRNCFWGYDDRYSMRPENWARNIRRTSEKLQGVRLTSYDFEKVLAEISDGAFLFVDPPYFNADQDKFYNCVFSDEDHIRLSEALKNHSQRLNFLLTYDNTEDVRKLYDWATNIHDKQWNYTINRTDDQKNGKKKDDEFKGERYAGKEIFIVNSLTTEMLARIGAASPGLYVPV